MVWFLYEIVMGDEKLILWNNIEEKSYGECLVVWFYVLGWAKHSLCEGYAAWMIYQRGFICYKQLDPKENITSK